MATTKKTVFITGSTRGIGLALATYYTKAGWNVIGTARANSNTEKLAALSPFKIVTIDTTDGESVTDVARQLEGVAIDLLINNAGTGWLTEIVEPTKAMFVDVYEVNVVGPFLVTRALQPNLQLAAKLRGSASVVQISSILGSISSNVDEFANIFNGQYIYTSSKAALNMVTRSLARDLRESKVAVVVVHPGYVNTELTGNLGVLKPSDVAASIAGVADKLTIEDTGKFLNADPTYPNSELPCPMDTTPKLADGPSSAFAVPQRLFAGRKRRAEAATDPGSSPFFTADEFAAFSVRGDVHESRLYGEFEAKRRTIVTPETPDSGRKSSAVVQVKKQTKHLMLLLVEAIEANRIQRPEKMLELDNARRRVSGIPVAQHERYLQLQRKLFQAQQRGLPEVLALSADEAKQWGQMKADVEMEQVGFCRMMARSLAAEAAANEMQMPAFALSLYEAMLTQCWNDIYRLYPRWFEPCVVVQLPSGGTLSGTGSAAIKAKEVSARGSCCAIDPRKLTPGQPLKTASDESGGVALEVVSPRQVISADLEAEELMEKYDCDLAISSSTLVSLFDSDTSTRFAHVPAGWGIPMKSRAIIHGGASKKRIFLDRPLPGNRPTTREKVAEAGRATLLSRFETESVVQGSTGGRTAYHIWQLDDKRVLVRSTTQASLITTASAAGSTPDQPRKHSIAPLSVFVKPDYNVLGVEEQLTTSERCRFWLHSWLRGGSTVLVARVNPKKNIITSWTTYSPASLIYGDKNQQTLPLESFDPASKFQWLSTLFTALSDIPVGNYLLRPHDANGSSTFGKRRGGVEVLMATAEPGIETPAIDLYGFMPRRTNGAAAAVLPMSDAMPPAYSVLPSWNLRDRIPYTFQTGMYCTPFFLEGQCPQISRGESCEHIHLRLLERVAGSKAPVKARRWKFDNYTKVLKKAARANFEMLNRPVPVTLNYAFCGEENAPPSDPTAVDLYAHMRCPKPPGECQLPHFTLHQILERLADDLLRKGRGKRREQKSGNRQQHQRPGRSSHGAQDD